MAMLIESFFIVNGAYVKFSCSGFNGESVFCVMSHLCRIIDASRQANLPPF